MKKLTPMQFFAMLICTRAFSMMTFLPESTANALELMLGKRLWKAAIPHIITI